MIKTLLAVGAGSFIGGIARYLVSKFSQTYLALVFPYGTFLVNITGCLLIGIFFGLSERNQLINTEIRLFLTVGLCGGFTTFSTFAQENFIFLRTGNYLPFFLYTSFSLILGISAVFLGYQIIKFLN